MVGRKVLFALAVPLLVAVPLVARARNQTAREADGSDAGPVALDVEVDPWTPSAGTRRIVIGAKKKKGAAFALDPWSEIRKRPNVDPADVGTAPGKPVTTEVDRADPWSKVAPHARASSDADPWTAPAAAPRPPADIATGRPSTGKDAADPWSPPAPADPKAASDRALDAAIRAALDAGDLDRAAKLLELLRSAKKR